MGGEENGEIKKRRSESGEGKGVGEGVGVEE